jgi:hypothetical protein
MSWSRFFALEGIEVCQGFVNRLECGITYSGTRRRGSFPLRFSTVAPSRDPGRIDPFLRSLPRSWVFSLLVLCILGHARAAIPSAGAYSANMTTNDQVAEYIVNLRLEHTLSCIAHLLTGNWSG